MPKGAMSAARSGEASRRPGGASGFRVMKIQPSQTSERIWGSGIPSRWKQSFRSM